MEAPSISDNRALNSPPGTADLLKDDIIKGERPPKLEAIDHGPSAESGSPKRTTCVLRLRPAAIDDLKAVEAPAGLQLAAEKSRPEFCPRQKVELAFDCIARARPDSPREIPASRLMACEEPSLSARTADVDASTPQTAITANSDFFILNGMVVSRFPCHFIKVSPPDEGARDGPQADSRYSLAFSEPTRPIFRPRAFA